MPCQTTIPSPTSSSSTLNAATSAMTTQQQSTATPSPTSGLDCNNVQPPRKDGESWQVENCTTATCQNGIVYTRYDCPYCNGSDGQLRKLGETWQTNCDQCECDASSVTIQCQPFKCPTQANLTCNLEGQVIVTETLDCCQRNRCECNVSLCPKPQPCSPGYTLVTKTPAGPCCPSYECEPKPVCVFNNTEFKVGETMPSDDCEVCNCSTNIDPITKLHLNICVPMTCDTNCQQGFEYQTVQGQCCGICVQSTCIASLPDNTTHLIEPGQSWSPANDKCVTYECEKIGDKLTTVKVKAVCPEFDPGNCMPGTETTDADGCCQTCTPIQNCNLMKNSSILVHNTCQSADPVELSSCTGYCGTYSLYSANANDLVHSCSCCQETSVSKKQVQLVCPDGSTMDYTYTYIESCSCSPVNCATTAAGK
nr:intestinal mucin-like protein [Paramormyrops kingsleyae]